MSNKCENQSALYIDWELGNNCSAPCENEAYSVIVDHTGFKWLCEDCKETYIRTLNIPESGE